MITARDIYRITIFSDVRTLLEPLAELLSTTDAIKAAVCSRDIAYQISCACANTLAELLDIKLKTSDNIFSRAMSADEVITPYTRGLVNQDLKIIADVALISSTDMPVVIRGELVPWSGGVLTSTPKTLGDYYRSRGFGKYTLSDTFTYTDNSLMPAPTPKARLSDLKNYEEEKNEVLLNTRNFIEGKPAFNTLLYGDRGTGKSTTVSALVNEFKGKLKIVQVYKENLCRLPELMTELDLTNRKWIVFLDDLAFDDGDDRFSALKAALEGSLPHSDNVLVYATTNRRHLIKENDDDGRGDNMQEKMALFDRFGLVVTYIAPNKDEFIDILRQLLKERGLKWRSEYGSIAELAALKKGGRTPRAAKQIADLITSQKQNGSM